MKEKVRKEISVKGGKGKEKKLDVCERKEGREGGKGAERRCV